MSRFPVTDFPNHLVADLITSHLVVELIKKRCRFGAVPLFIRQKGDTERGTILLCLQNLLGQAQFYHQARDQDFNLIWQRERPVCESEAENRIQSAMKADRDQWVIEIEDPHMRFPLSEQVPLSERVDIRLW